MLVRQLERELTSTVSALRDERREKRGQAEALKSKLDKARGAARDLETELERCDGGREGGQWLQGRAAAARGSIIFLVQVSGSPILEKKN